MADTPAPDLCVSVTRSQASIKRGQTASYVVNVWTENGDASGVSLALTATPSSQKPKFSFGCGKDDGTASCALGTVADTNATRQLQAQITVAKNATSVSSVTLTSTAKATDVKTDPKAAASVSVTAAPTTSTSPSASATPSSSSTAADLGGDTSTLPVGTTLPSLNGSGSSYLSTGGNASGLFPTINPSAQPSPGTDSKPTSDPAAEPAADSTTLPLGTPVVGAQIAGLGALAVAFVLAITRLSVRRRPATPKPPEES